MRSVGTSPTRSNGLLSYNAPISYADESADPSHASGAMEFYSKGGDVAIRTDNGVVSITDAERLAQASFPTLEFRVDGALSAGSDKDYLPVPSGFTIVEVAVVRGTAGSSGSTIVDVHKNGTTIFTNQDDRPEIAYDAGNYATALAVPAVTTVAEDDVLTVDIDQVEGGSPSDLRVAVTGYHDGLGSPHVCLASRYGGANQSISPTTYTEISYPHTVIDSTGGSMHDESTNNGRIYAPVDGLYIAVYNVYFYSIGGYNTFRVYRQIRLSPGGAYWHHFFRNSGGLKGSMAGIYYLEAGQYANTYLYHTASNPQNVFAYMPSRFGLVRVPQQ